MDGNSIKQWIRHRTASRNFNFSMGADDGGSAQTRYIFEALESIRLAKFSEEQFEYENASRLYDTAVHLFITGVQKDGNKERQDLVRKKLAKCLAKAEKCRAIVRSKGSSSTNKIDTIDDDDGEDEDDDDDDDLLTVDKKHFGGVETENGSNQYKSGSTKLTKYSPMDYLQSSSISKHFNHSDNTDWPHNLNHYQLKQVITSDIWLVARLIDKNDANLAIMVGVPRINKNQPVPHNGNSSLANQETLETIDTSRIPHYELGKALSLRIAAIMYRPNRYHITTGQKFLQEFITDIALEIRTQYTIFCIVRATKENLEYAKNVRKLVTNMRHSSCKDAASNCQACQLRQTQRNIIRFNSSSGSSSLSERSSLSGGSSSDDDRTKNSRKDDSKNKIKVKDSFRKGGEKLDKTNTKTKNFSSQRKLSQDEVRKSLAAKIESESGLSSGSPDIRSPEIKSSGKASLIFNTTASASPSHSSSKQSIPSKRRVSTPIIVLNKNKIREKTKAYEKKAQMELHSNSNSDADSQNESSLTPTTSGICTTASSSNTTSRCASSESNASTQKPDYGETRTLRAHKVTKKVSIDCSSTGSNGLQCDEVIDLVEQAGQLVIES